MLETDKMQQTAGEFARLNTDPHSIRSLLGQEGRTAQTNLGDAYQHHHQPRCLHSSKIL